MANRSISIKKEIVKGREGVAILDLEKYRALKEKLEEYEKKEKLLKSLTKFENLAKWEGVLLKRREWPKTRF